MPTSGRPVLDDPLSRFLAPRGDCVEWTGAKFKSGYGEAHHRGKHWRAHRLAWTMANGPIPDGLHVLHSCDNPACCKLEHLRLGTAAENAADKMARGRHSAQSQTHCKQGHAFTPENTYIAPDGRRGCRSCRRAVIRRRDEARRARKR